MKQYIYFHIFLALLFIFSALFFTLLFPFVSALFLMLIFANAWFMHSILFLTPITFLLTACDGWIYSI
ncbi:MAG: hypothetical protein ACRCWQ_05595, partial [Bacilli bacterium]